MKFSEPLIFVVVKPTKPEYYEKMAVLLSKFATEDSSFQVRTDEESGQAIILGTSESHLDNFVERLRRDVDANVGAPQVFYRETIKEAVKIDKKFVRQYTCPSSYGHVCLMLEPKEPNSGFEFINKIKGNVIPKEYIPAINEGVIHAMQKGVLAGYPIIDVSVTLLDGSFHEVDSSQMAFKIAGSMAFKAGVEKASPVLLEPIMAIEIVTPNDYTENVISDLNRRRGMLCGIDESSVIQADVPLGEMFGYATDLQSLTQKRGSYTMQFSKYHAVPKNIANVVIKKNEIRKWGA